MMVCEKNTGGKLIVHCMVWYRALMHDVRRYVYLKYQWGRYFNALQTNYGVVGNMKQLKNKMK